MTNNRNRDRRPDGNKKFGNKSDWNSQGGSGGGQWGNNWNNYGNNSGLLRTFFDRKFIDWCFS